MLKLLTQIFGSSNDRAIKKLQPQIAAVSALEDRIKALDDAALKAKTAEFRQKLDNGAKLDDIRFEAFAVAREAAWRVLGMRPYDVQVLGGFVLHSGRIAEMKTGEGKTLVATLPTYLNALEGRGVHVVTVNDYLARRDAEWMGQLYRWLGLTTGVIVNGLNDAERQQAYGSDITYGQNNEFGFDYLRDNMKFDLSRYVQRELRYAIIDEVDSILIDEARTPLIISGPAEHQPENYILVDKLIPRLKKDIHWNVDEKAHSATLTEEGVEEMQRLLRVDNLYDPGQIVLLHHVNNALKAHALYRRDVNYLVADGEVMIIDEHTGRLMPGRRWSDGLHQAIEAKEGVDIQPENHTLATISFQNYFRLYDKLSGMTGTAKTEEEEFQKIYTLDVVVVPTNKPIIRKDQADIVYRSERGKFRACVAQIKASHEKGQPVLVGTTSVEKSEIIHRMLRAEGVPHEVLNAKHHAREAAIVAQAGRLGAVTVATNMAGRGTDIILGGNAEYWGQNLIAEAGIAVRHTPEWEKVEDFVKQIVIGNEQKAREMREQFEVLHAVPEEFIGQIAETRSTFKREQKDVLSAGGLFILGTERHESRRIDNQLRGRAGRQGDPGESRFYLSLEDDLMRIFANDRMTSIMDTLGMSDDAPIEHSMVTRAIENAQERVEAQHFDSRKNLLEYDDVMNQQRKTIYKWRREVLGAEGEALREMVFDAIEDLVNEYVDVHCDAREKPEAWDVQGLIDKLRWQFNVDVDLSQLPTSRERYREHAYFAIEAPYRAKVEEIDEKQPGLMQRVEKDLLLRHIDQHWKDHLTTMDQLRTGIGLRGYGQRDPKKEYQKEGFRLFNDLLVNIKAQVMGQLFRLQVRSEEEIRREEEEYRRRIEAQQRQMQMLSSGAEKTEDGRGPAPNEVLARGPQRAAVRRDRPKIGRNDPCWCGSGKKYKKCHMEADQADDRTGGGRTGGADGMKEASSGVPGFRFAGLPCGIKKTGAPDLALLVADAVAPCAGVFTTNRVVAAPVVQSREKLSTQGKARAVIINSGNANACTGARGAEDARRMAEAAAAQLGCSADEVLVCSTGVIGATLPIERIEAALPDAVARLSGDGLADFAEAIRTTDTQRKMRRSTFGWDGRDYHLAGAVKGAGMIHPNMATMLAFLVTDAPVAPDELFGVWYRVCHRTFNAITIDGDTSTNDTALLFAGALGEPLTGDGLAALEHALGELARELALDIIRDAEGGTKTVAISVTGAASLADAAAAAEAIALSPLVKTALHGEDPNWGRIIAAAGRSGASFHPDGLRLWIGDTLLYADGQWQGPVAEAEAHDVMQTVEYGIRLDLGSGRAHRTLYTCDLSADYVRINADYRS